MPSDETEHLKALSLPALRGHFGDWTYYSALLPLSTIAARVSFADEIHKSKALSELIQRSLKGGKGGSRSKDIAQYLRNEKERFFNSLVVAVYGGNPEWFPIQIQRSSPDLPDPPKGEEILGALRLSGSEKLFAVDGQHRLAGMKRLTSEDGSKKPPGALSDLVSIIFIAHRTDKIERTRRLFTTLNKTAVPVSKMERIALDENDAMAITVRRLVEDHDYFSGPRIAPNHTNNLGSADNIALTTLGNLYDVLRSIFVGSTGKKRRTLEYERPTESELDKYFQEGIGFFNVLAKVDSAIAAYFMAKDEKALRKICTLERSKKGGSVLFRPIGLAIFAELVTLLRKRGRKDWLEVLSRLPLSLSKSPYMGTIWTERGTIEPKHRVLCRNLLSYMCGESIVSEATLRQRLADIHGADADLARLPERVH